MPRLDQRRRGPRRKRPASFDPETATRAELTDKAWSILAGTDEGVTKETRERVFARLYALREAG